VLCIALLAMAPLWARGFDYGLVTNASVQRCDALRWQSDRAAAGNCFRALLGNADASVRAEAAWALGEVRTANEAFREALRAAPGSALLRLRWGDLYVDTHQDSEAYKLYAEVLQREPDNAWAHVAAAAVLIGGYSKDATTHIEAVFNNKTAPPGAVLRAHLLGARVTLENGEDEEATKQLAAANALVASAALPDVELNTLLAAQAQLHDHANAALIAAVLKVKPGYGELYATLAHYYEVRRRYDEATALYRKAIELDPDLWDARVQLATSLLRESRQSEARTLLEAAYKGDPFNPVTANTLRLLDQLGKFDTLVFPEAAANGATTAPEIVVRINKKESAVLAPYVRLLAEQGMKQYAQRYHFTLKQPVTIEIYNNHEDFAVRTAGMPGLGLLGVTFGNVLAMDSPSSRAVNEFHWGSTLWHEMAHVYTLESTQHRVPRWFSEGLSVYEEWSSGPIKGVTIPGYAYAALAAGKALPIAELDRGFIRPEYEQQVQVSYMQAGLICEFIAARFGADKFVAMLADYAKGQDTPVVINAALGVPVDDFDKQFNAWLRKQYGAVLDGVKPWTEARAAAYKAVAARNWSVAVTQAQRALAILPADAEDGSAYVPLAQAQLALGQLPAAVATLGEYWHRGGHDPEALEQLANEYQTLGRKSDAIAVMQSINYVAPFDEALHGRLGDWLLDLNRAAEALVEFKVALALNPPDGATANYRVARAYEALQQPREARAAVLRALEIAPSFKPAQQLLLQLAQASKKT
jgi:tetratricopeptide (TPR) repeat protein